MARRKQPSNDSPIYHPTIIQKSIDEAIKYAEEKQIPLTLGRLCACLGIDRNTVIDYVNGVTAVGNENEKERENREISVEIIKKAWRLCNADCEDSLAIGRGTVGNIFLAKNNYGYVDKVEVDTTNKVVFSGENEIKD